MSDKLTSVFWGGKLPDTHFDIDKLLPFHNYEVGYNYKLKMPLWSAEVITQKEAETSVGRANGFKVDTRIPEEFRHTTRDYVHSHEDRFHLTASADAGTHDDMEETFMTDNVVPAPHKLNAGVWLQIEEKTRKLAEDYDEVYVVTGAIFDDFDPDVKDLCVPTFVYKAVLIPDLKTTGVYVAGVDESGDYTLMSHGEFAEKYDRTPMPGQAFGMQREVFEL